MKNWFFRRKKRLTEVWPKDENGQTVEPVYLTHCVETQMELEITVNMLQAYGIPVVTKYSSDGSFGKVMIGMSGSGCDLYVPKTMLEDAKNLISGEGEFEQQDEQEQ